MLTADQMQTLSDFRTSYEAKFAKQMKSLNYDYNSYYFETCMQNFTEEEIKKNFVTEMVDSMIKKHVLRNDFMEQCRAVDAIRNLQQYLLSRPDVPRA